MKFQGPIFALALILLSSTGTLASSPATPCKDKAEARSAVIDFLKVPERHFGIKEVTSLSVGTVGFDSTMTSATSEPAFLFNFIRLSKKFDGSEMIESGHAVVKKAECGYLSVSSDDSLAPVQL